MRRCSAYKVCLTQPPEGGVKELLLTQFSFQCFSTPRRVLSVYIDLLRFLRLSVAKPDILNASMECQESRNIYQIKPTRIELTAT